MKRKLLHLGIGFSFVILLCWGVTSQTHLLKCRAGSLSNIKYLLITKVSSLKRGDIVCLRGHETQYVEEDKLLAKRILGLPGDHIKKETHGIMVLAQPPSSSSFNICPLLEKTKQGDPLTPISASYIPEGFIFVAGDHPRSFDSRYEEFGLVPLEKVKGKAVWWW